jgi:hypothetical protein
VQIAQVATAEKESILAYLLQATPPICCHAIAGVVV